MAWQGENAAAAELAQDLFAPLGAIRIRRMFGGAAIYAGERVFALIADGEIYLRTDVALARALAAEGARQFAWYDPRRARTVAMRYWTLPETALDDAEAALDWARRALSVG